MGTCRASARRSAPIPGGWVQLLTVTVFVTFIVYSTWAVLQGNHYYASPYLSPFYSPVLFTTSDVPGAAPLDHAWFGDVAERGGRASLPASPALLILAFPGSFRFTCYYYRKAYYRVVRRLAAGLRGRAARRGTRSTAARRRCCSFQNLHRYALYFALAVHPDPRPTTRSSRSSATASSASASAAIILSINAVLLAGYTFGCHSFRHLIGGREDCMSLRQATRCKYGAWKHATWFNERHMQFAWVSLFWVMFTDLYVRLRLDGRDHRPQHLELSDARRLRDPDHRARRASSSAPAAPGCAPRSSAARTGLNTGVISKSLLGKAHTVMAEGGMAAALGNVDTRDNWKVHFRDTMRGGKFLNVWRMAELHAKQAPERVRELEEWGAVFDRTKDGLISQRNFGGHRYPRLAHVGDRTGPRADPLAAGPRRPPGHRLPHGVHRARAAQGRRAHRRRARVLARDRALRRVPLQGGDPRDRRRRQGVARHVELVGVHRRRHRAWRTTPAPS